MMAGNEDDRKRLDRLVGENTDLLDAFLVENLRQPGQEQVKIAFIEKTVQENQRVFRILKNWV